MAAKQNCRKDTPRPGVPLPFALALGLIGSLALGYLWISSRCDALQRQIRKQEERRGEIHKKIVNEELRWSMAKSPRNLEFLMRRFGLELALPEEAQLVRINSAPVLPGRPAGGLRVPLLAYQSTRSALAHD